MWPNLTSGFGFEMNHFCTILANQTHTGSKPVLMTLLLVSYSLITTIY